MRLLKNQWVNVYFCACIHIDVCILLDLTTLEENVKADAYPTMEDFIKDTQKIFDNCKTYNAEDTDYSKCAVKLERFFNEKLRTVNKN